MDNQKLTILEESIMLAICSVPLYGTAISDAVNDASDGRHPLNPGTLYPALRRLEKRGLIEGAETDEAQKIRNGHSRRYYQVTREGIRILNAVEDTRMRLKAMGDCQESMP